MNLPASDRDLGFRSVLASPDEAIVLALVDALEDQDLRPAIDAVGHLHEAGGRFKLVIYVGAEEGASVATIDAPFVSVLEPWARGMLPAILAASDVVVASGSGSRALLGELRDSCRDCAIVASAGRLEELGDIGRVRRSWDGRNAEAFGRILREVCSDPSGSAPVPGHPASPGRDFSGTPTSGSLVLYNDWGIGDELLLSAVARELVRSNPGLDVWIRSRFGFRFTDRVRRDPVPAGAGKVETIYQNPTLYSPKAHSPFPGHLVQQMLDKVALDTGIRVKARDLRPELALPAKRRPDPRKRSVIVHSRPNTRLSSKDWGMSRWHELSRILTGRGWNVRQVGGKDEPAIEGVEDLRGIPVSELPEVFLGSDAVVCVVGFLMHLAEATRTPAVVIYGGREHPAIDGYSDQVHLCSEPLECRGRWGCHLGPDLECPHGMRCMEQLTPDLAARSVLNLFEKDLKGARP